MPTEHLAPNHIEELRKPVYSTCLGLILKGYSDYEHKHKQFTQTFTKVSVPKTLTVETPAAPVQQEPQSVNMKDRKPRFWDKFKDNLIDLFKEEEDQVIK